MSQKTLGSFGFCSRGSTQDVQSIVETPDTSESESVRQTQSELEPTDDLVDEETSDSESTLTSNCSCPCCTRPESSHQPLEVSDSKVAVAHHSKERKAGQKKTYLRSIQPSWYGKHPWISVCTTRYKIFCSVCRGAKQLGLVKFSKYQKSVFTDEGYGNWTKALQRFQDHEKSDMHREATEKMAARSSGMNVMAQLSAHYEADVMFHRKMLMKLLSCIRYLARQGLPLRGHHEDPQSFGGNLYQLLLQQAQDCLQMKTWLCRREYISPEIVNELIKIMGQTVLRQILAEIKSTMFFSLIADEASDISHNEYINISIRWVDSDFDIHEDALGLVQLPDTKAATLFSVIKDVLIRCSLPISQCRGQAFDGASNMSGVRNGVQALIKQEESRALYVHCLAHSLNLCVQEVTRKCVNVRNVMDFIYELVQLIKFSPKRLHVFESLKRNVVVSGGDATPRLRTLCPTRWTIRHTSINSILLNYETFLKTLEDVQNGSDEYAAKASGLHARIELFDTYFGLKLAHLVFSAAEQFSTNLQAEDITIQEATRGAELLVSHLKTLRTEAQFNRFYEQVLAESLKLTDEPKLPRNRKIPKRYNQGEPSHQYLVPKDKYRHTYFETLELAFGEVERRFEQSDLCRIKDIENLLLDAANGRDTEPISDAVLDLLKSDVDCNRLKIQLLMVPDMIKTAFACELPIKKVTNVRTVASAMKQSEIYKGMLNEINKVLKLYFTFPVTSATAERSFSSLRRIKTYLQNSMSHCRLNNLFLLHVHSAKTDSLDLGTVAKEFVGVNSRRLQYFGSF